MAEGTVKSRLLRRRELLRRKLASYVGREHVESCLEFGLFLGLS